ncbi:olfactory receptor 11A1-like [Nothobranchius furzeri]|uniref:olfactory receptor 11A1-like n=1 Tax=Nothobranchius furzeri TaxID=105023 RepID=UPI002403F71D|nr:olfactory receptor 11A1-like [Nothobranchius furzeri]
MNVTYITLDGHVEVEKYRFLYFVIMLMAYILILSSNFTIVYLIVVHKDLHEPMYVFIAALLINSVLFSTVVYPKLLFDFLSDKQIISYQACLFQVCVFYSLYGSEFLLLAAMAYDRYVSICKPLHYPTIMRKATVIILLVLSWLLPVCHFAVPVIGNAQTQLCSFTLKGIFCNNSINQILCVTSRALLMFGLVILVNINLLPLLFILFTYTMIFITTYKRCGQVRKKVANTCLPHLLVLINYSCLLTFEMTIVRLDSDISNISRFVMTVQMIMYNPLGNPIIYGIKMKEIYKHLKRLLCQAKSGGEKVGANVNVKGIQQKDVACLDKV